MKKIILVLLVTAVAISYSRAQSSTNSAARTIFNSVEAYFTSLNTNYTFQGVKLEVDTGYAQVTGVNAASKLNLQYDITDNFDVGASFQFSGVGSAINAEQGQIGYALVNYFDTKAEAILRAGYDDTMRAGVFEPGITLKKKLTPNTYGETAITMPIYTSGQFVKTPTFYFGVGFTF